MKTDIIHGDCLDVMRTMADNSIDFVVTDPPYALTGKSGKGGFMGKEWDAKLPSLDIWKELLRICKPGAMLAAFGAPRTHHKLMLALEEAGWILRDMMMWINGQSFPKSHNFGCKCREFGTVREQQSTQDRRRQTCETCQGIIGFEGYGSALKSSYEPIILAMKPLDGTYKQNVEKWGIGGINIDECRIPTNGEDLSRPFGHAGIGCNQLNSIPRGTITGKNQLGRWPANIILDDSAATQLDEMTPNLSKSPLTKFHNNKSNIPLCADRKTMFTSQHLDSGGASRFFYCAKVSTSERNRGLERMPLKEAAKIGNFNENPGRNINMGNTKCKNFHPTVKPIALMKYIIKLLAPPNNPTLLDPFAGSGSTLLAAIELGINSIGIEKEAEYAEIARNRIKHVLENYQYNLKI